MSGDRSRAVGVYRDTVCCGPAAGLAVALAVMTVGVVTSGAKADPLLLAYVATYFVVGAAGLGALAGLFGGAVVYRLVRCGEPRLGPRRVAILIPLVALGTTVPLAWLGAAGTTIPVAVVAIDVVIALAGSSIVAWRYVRATP